MALESQKNVIIRISYCKGCKGWVRASVLNKMTPQSLYEFEDEVEFYDLKVVDKSLEDYQTISHVRCACP